MTYHHRRQHLLASIGEGSIALIAAAPEKSRNGDTHYPYRQDSSFYYLTGFNEPEAVAVFIPGRSSGEFILFNRPSDATAALWTGERAGQDGACDDFGADQSFPIEALASQLPILLEGHRTVYYPVGKDSQLDSVVMTAVNSLQKKVRRGGQAPTEFVNLDRILSEMRLHKEDEEIELMAQVSEISAQAHRHAMMACRPGMMEYEVEAELLHTFCQQGCRTVAYESIVAGGSNACVLHYTDNRSELRDGDLLLIDAGAEYHNYAADITRTFPINGRFSQPQRAIYELVLSAQLAGIEQVKPGTPWDQIQKTMVSMITAGLVELGLLEGEVESLIKDKAYEKFYMHSSGHWLGLDVHDVGEYKVDDQWRPLEPGMVLTVEPGIYISADCNDVDSQWRGIGVRIEDDVLVTEQGHRVLSAAAPKTVSDIESLMSHQSSSDE